MLIEKRSESRVKKMDRRIKKTRKAIIEAFLYLLEEKPFDKIRVKEILEVADVGRATFYSHFESKEILLEEVSLLLFHHIFEEGVDYPTLGALLEHMFEHIQSDAVLKRLLTEQERYLYKEFQQHLEEFLWPIMRETNAVQNSKLPESFLLMQLISSVMTTLQWWLKYNSDLSPQEVSHICQDYLLGETVGIQ